MGSMIKILIEEYFNRRKQNRSFILLYALICYFRQINFRVIVLIRLMQSVKSVIVKEFIFRKLLVKYGVEISPEATIGKNLRIEHSSGIVIGKNVIVGNGVTVYQNVTIGQKNGLYPRLVGNNIIYPGAVVIGGILIGKNSIIQANSFVMTNVPANVIVGGNPARVLKTIET